MHRYAIYMKVLRAPRRVSGVIFDIDNTLYRNRAYTEAQTELLIERLATERASSFAETWEAVEAVRTDYAKQNDGRRPSLANAFLEFGVNVQTSARWREQLFDPSRYLESDEKLYRTVSTIASHATVVAVTNNPESIGEQTLACLGVSSLFGGVIGLDSTGVSKPDYRPFEAGLKRIGGAVARDEVVSVGDRIEVDLEPAMELGMAAILVESMEDVYSLAFEGAFAELCQ